MYPRLNQKTAERLCPGGMPSCGRSRPVRVLQIGTGNFLRGFVCWMIDRLNAADLFDGGIAVTQATPGGETVDALNEQDRLYTLLLRGIRDGEHVDQTELITSVVEAFDPFDQWKRMRTLAAEPMVRYVVSNTTEAGIRYDAVPFDPDRCPESFPARAAMLLYERFRKSEGRADAGWVFLPCELIERNGRTLREHILHHAEDWDLPDVFRDWVRSHCTFADTLVDRIIPGFPADEFDALCERLGYEDRLLVAGEWYHRWVIEGPAHLSEALPFDKAGLNVVWTSDLTPHLTTKVRILNGAHTAMVPVAMLRGKTTVREAIEDAQIRDYIHTLLFDEVIPALDLPGEDTKRFANATLERFANPHIEHQLSSISLNSVSKWRVRLLPTMLSYTDRFRELPQEMALSLAALIVMYRGDRCALNDEEPVETFFAEAWKAFGERGDLAALVDMVLRNEDLWGMDLRAIAGLPRSLEVNIEEMLSDE